MTNKPPGDLSGPGSCIFVQSIVSSFHHDNPRGTEATFTIDAQGFLFTDLIRDPDMRHLTGTEPTAIDYVLNNRAVHTVLHRTAPAVRGLLAEVGDPRFIRVDVAFRYSQDRYRAVAMANEFASILRSSGVGVEVEHNPPPARP